MRGCAELISTGVFRANSAGCLWGCTEIKDCAVVMQILKFCLKSLFFLFFFFLFYWKSSVKKTPPNNPPQKNKPCSKMQHSFSVNNRDPCAVKAGPWWTNSMAQLQQTTHRWGRFPSFRGADESEILGLVSTEWGRSVLCHHWYVVWRRCGGHRRALWDKKTQNIWDKNATSDVFKLLEKHPLFFLAQCIPGVIFRWNVMGLCM